MYRRARNLYWRLFNRTQHSRCARERQILQRFVAKGSLAFDVGANVGDVTSLLLDLGARVVAVEPDPRLAEVVSMRYRVPTENVALGASVGSDHLYLGSDPAHSSLSVQWRSLHEARFTSYVPVRVTTLDVLIERYGRPDFVKIDVEGYEAEVLNGLSTAVQALSFEYQRGLLEPTERSLARLRELGTYSFQFVTNSRSGSSALQPVEPTNAETLLRLIGDLAPDAYGDVYAQLRTPAP